MRKSSDFSGSGSRDEDPVDHHTGGEFADTVKTGGELESYIDDIADTVRIGLDQSIAILTPWFFNNMPSVYYQTTPRPEKIRHLSTIITGHVFETKQTVELWDRERSKVTYIGPGGDRGILVDMAQRLQDHPIKMGSIYFSHDKLLFLSTFLSSDFRPIDESNTRITDKITSARKLINQEFPDEEAQIEKYLDNLDNDFVIYATAARIQITYRMVRHMLGHQGAHTLVEPIENSPKTRLTLGIKNVRPNEILEQIFNLFSRQEFNIRRAFMIQFEQGFDEPISVMHFTFDHDQLKKIDLLSPPMLKINKALRTLGWVDNDEYNAFTVAPYKFSVNASNYLRSLASWVHIHLSKQNPYYYSHYKIRRTFHRNVDITEDLIELFRIRFDPLREKERQEKKFDSLRKELLKRIDEIIDEVEKNILRECINFTKHVLKTNYFLQTKTGLAFRLAPEVLDPNFYPQQPFGIFFITGRDYRFFQLRWKDVSRGGLRVVMPRTATDYDFSLAGLFDEVYGLSHAQQMKNKDIPEGGSKAVLLLKPKGQRDHAVKGAVNALLDLLVADDETHSVVESQPIKYYLDEEIIYLGPDENMTNDLIEWVTNQASRRGYKYARAFMSSKPADGINHKQYGVTSEGVNVFLENTLRYLGINPKETPFSIKMTGGPDGDVAGNELKILYREYGENAKVVAISDGYGAAYDPEGLDWNELLRLTNEETSICEFSQDKLKDKENGFVIITDVKENIKTRDELHFNVKADIFIPAGGRPYTVKGSNWHKFLDEDEKLTTKAVIEGANIFFTDEARMKLQKFGLIMVKDSSANKTGVICSSYEIMASLTLSREEFIAIKDEYVKQVIEILRQKADVEAKLMFRHYAQEGLQRTLVDLSLQVSKEINEITDVLLEELISKQDEILNDPVFQEVIYKHCPPILVTKYKDRILERLPKSYQIAVISAYIGSYIIYQEGLGWLQEIPAAERFKAMMTYVRQDKLALELIQSVTESDLKNKDKIASILRKSAARDLTLIELSKLD